MIREHRPPTVVEVNDDPVMGSVVTLVVLRAQQSPAPGHPEMAHPSGVVVEPNQEVLRSPFYALDQPAAQHRLESFRKWEPKVETAQLDLLNTSAHEMILKASPDGLDLGQLGHGPLNRFDSMILTTP